MNNAAVHYSSKSDDWATPQDFFESCAKLFKFGLDVCASEENRKCPLYFSKQNDALKQDWTLGAGACWMNPPYGRGIGAWVKKAYETAQAGRPVVCLLPARTDTKWWQQYCTQGLVHFIPGRLKFGNAAHNAPFPCALVIFHAFGGAA